MWSGQLNKETKGIPFFFHVLCIWALPVWGVGWVGGSKCLPGWFGALIYRHNGDFANFLKLVPECPAPECPVESLLMNESLYVKPSF